MYKSLAHSRIDGIHHTIDGHQTTFVHVSRFAFDVGFNCTCRLVAEPV